MSSGARGTDGCEPPRGTGSQTPSLFEGFVRVDSKYASKRIKETNSYRASFIVILKASFFLSYINACELFGQYLFKHSVHLFLV